MINTDKLLDAILNASDKILKVGYTALVIMLVFGAVISIWKRDYINFLILSVSSLLTIKRYTIDKEEI